MSSFSSIAIIKSIWPCGIKQISSSQSTHMMHSGTAVSCGHSFQLMLVELLSWGVLMRVWPCVHRGTTTWWARQLTRTLTACNRATSLLRCITKLTLEAGPQKNNTAV